MMIATVTMINSERRIAGAYVLSRLAERSNQKSIFDTRINHVCASFYSFDPTVHDLKTSVDLNDITAVQCWLEFGGRRDHALYHATHNGDLEMAKYIVECGTNTIINNTVVLMAAAYGYVDLLQYFVELGADVRACNDYPLCLAALNGRLEIVKYLVTLGVDIQAYDNNAVRWAAQNGHLQMVRYLVELGADFRAMNDEAERIASKNGHLEVVKYLVERGYSSMHIKNDSVA